MAVIAECLSLQSVLGMHFSRRDLLCGHLSHDGVLHGDLNEKNVLTRPPVKEGRAEDGGDRAGDEVYAVLDWGDVHGGPRVLDLAVLLAYVLIAPTGSRSAEENAGLALSAYLRHVPEEREHVPLLRVRNLRMQVLGQ
ncbi:hypothetical protein HPB48_010460 [Haemaphysalis longicornis]|uniref:Hydroxylysine kinase n=1 Tax=Haemaphysalis longicornis TaxID=44386 RepID=A0A9J6H331_HAELO|nr:hypothetical protein HPB48_010460 [Haemaphysalis longicornis]